MGVDQLAGVGSTGAINFMIIGFCNGVCSGFAIPIAQSFGAKDYKRLRKFVANAAWLSIAFAAVMTVVVCVLCRQILSWMDTPENIFEYAYSYIFIIFLGIPATYLYNLLSGIIRSLGDSRTPVIFLVISAMLNILFDLLAILVLHMGVAGAAWATVLSQLISGILCFLYMRKQYDILKFEKDEMKLRGVRRSYLQHGHSNGSAVLHYSNRKCYLTDCSKLTWFSGRSRSYSCRPYIWL